MVKKGTRSLAWQNILIALNSIKGQKVRTAITVCIIAIGITSLVGVLTAIDSLKSSLTEQFTSMGANSFKIRRRTDFTVRKDGKKVKARPNITYLEAMSFAKLYEYPATVSISSIVSGQSVIKFKAKETNPNVRLVGGDEHYINVGGLTIGDGRNFTKTEQNNASSVVIIGSEIADDLFGSISPLGQIITLDNLKYQVIGVLKQKGNAMGFNPDRMAIIPISNVRQHFYFAKMSFDIDVKANTPQQLEAASNEATGLFRIIRKDPLGTEDSFRIRRSDSMVQKLFENLNIVTLVATIIAVITLLSASIGLMNIMLVSVTERTREIGTRKAIGAKSKTIMRQFLAESIVICQLGGLTGTILGISIGNVVAILLSGPFIIPWLWILIALIICVFVGVIAGFYPAYKAAKLDPIDSLRYE